MQVYNNIWETGVFLPSWREAVILLIVPIPKPGKDHLSPSNDCPIALTSCLCKTMERMVSARLVWSPYRDSVRFQEEPQYVRPSCSFQSRYLRCLCAEATCSGYFFNMEKAYDTTLADFFNVESCAES